MAVIIAGLPIDVGITEEHSFTNEVTQHPVEEGSDVTDHARAKPIEISLNCVMSDTPLLSPGERPSGVPSDFTYRYLSDIRNAREPVTITTSLGTFPNMMLQALSVPRSATNGDALRFTASFIQIELVTNNKTTIRVSAPRGRKKVKKGNKAAVVATPPAKSQSILTRLARSGI